MLLRRIGAHLARPSAGWGWLLTALSLAVYILVGTQFEESGVRDAVRQFFLIVASVTFGFVLLPELPSNLWSIDALRVRNHIPGEQREHLARELIAADSHRDPAWADLVWQKALDPLLVAAREPWQYVRDLDYNVDIRLGRELSIAGRSIKVTALSVDHKSIRVLARPDAEGLVVSIVRTGEALEREFKNPDCLARELTPFDGLVGEDWQQAVIKTCRVKVLVGGIPLDLEPVATPGEPDVVRFEAPVDFERSADPVRVRVVIDAYLDPEETEFPVAFSGYYCAGITEISVRLFDERRASSLTAHHFIARALQRDPLPEPVTVLTPEFERISFSTGRAGILWPGSGILFRWKDRADEDGLTWLAPIPAGLDAPDAPPITTPPALDAPQTAVPQVSDDGDPLVEIPGSLARQVVYDAFPLPDRGPLRLRQGLVDRLIAADAALPPRYGIVVLDGWRSPRYQQELLAHYRAQHPDLAAGFVADPEDDLVAPHTTGGAVDLTLSLDGMPLALGTDFDAFTDDARLDAFEGRPGSVRDLRRLLAHVLGTVGLAPYPQEWWHWSYGEQWWAAANGQSRTVYGVVDGEPAASTRKRTTTR